MTFRRMTSLLALVTLLGSSVPLFAAEDGGAPGRAASLNLRQTARAMRFDGVALSPWRASKLQTTTPHHRRALWIAIGAASGAAGGAFVGAALQSLAESSESLTPSAVAGGAIGGLAGGLLAALITRK